MQLPHGRETIPAHQGIFGVKSGYLPLAGVPGLRAGGYWRENPRRTGVEVYQSTLLLFHPQTGPLRGVVAVN